MCPRQQRLSQARAASGADTAEHYCTALQQGKYGLITCSDRAGQVAYLSARHSRAGQGRAGQGRAGQGMTGQGTAGQGMPAWHGMAVQGMAGQSYQVRAGRHSSA